MHVANGRPLSLEAVDGETVEAAAVHSVQVRSADARGPAVVAVRADEAQVTMPLEPRVAGDVDEERRECEWVVDDLPEWSLDLALPHG